MPSYQRTTLTPAQQADQREVDGLEVGDLFIQFRSIYSPSSDSVITLSTFDNAGARKAFLYWTKVVKGKGKKGRRVILRRKVDGGPLKEQEAVLSWSSEPNRFHEDIGFSTGPDRYLDLDRGRDRLHRMTDVGIWHPIVKRDYLKV